MFFRCLKEKKVYFKEDGYGKRNEFLSYKRFGNLKGRLKVFLFMKELQYGLW